MIKKTLIILLLLFFSFACRYKEKKEVEVKNESIRKSIDDIEYDTVYFIGNEIIFISPSEEEFSFFENEEGIDEVDSDFDYYSSSVFDSLKSTHSISFTSKRVLGIINTIGDTTYIDRIKEELHYGSLFNSISKKHVIEKGVFTDVDFYQNVENYFIDNERIKEESFRKNLIFNKLDTLFVPSNRIPPNVLISDFDGDNVSDIAGIVENKENGKLGVVIFHSNKTFYIIGAGNLFVSDWDDISGYNEWSIEKNKRTYEMVIDSITGDILGDKPVTIENIGISFREFEGSGGLIYWNGMEYKYLHQGD